VRLPGSRFPLLSLDEFPAELLFGGSLVVGATEESQVVDRRSAAFGQGNDVIELQSRGGIASPTFRQDLDTSASVTLVDGLADLPGNRSPRGFRLPRLGRRSEPSLLEPRDQDIECPVDDLDNVSAGHGVAKEFLQAA
jgi:hypothetical protein